MFIYSVDIVYWSKKKVISHELILPATLLALNLEALRRVEYAKKAYFAELIQRCQIILLIPFQLSKVSFSAY